MRSHYYPAIRLSLGQRLSARRLASAMIDLSDGLSTDLSRLCAASGVGARLWLNHLPGVHVPSALRERRIDPVRCALHGGDDYELLFTVPRRVAARVPGQLQGVRITQIGEITRAKEILTVDAKGRTSPLHPLGWDHFRK